MNTDTIFRKTKENFLNPNFSKYLVAEQINIAGKNVKIKEVENFETVNEEDINILFSTIQGLHTRLNNPKGNGITFDDFTDKEVVLISDEAHHINALTKKKLSPREKEELTSWEYTFQRILGSNPDNILMEFTATLELDHPNVASKYANKLLYDYSLARFREDGYSKEVQTNQVDYEPVQRAIEMESQMEYLQERFRDISLLRNERFFKIYRFSDGMATEPDFVLFLTEKASDEEIVYKLFIEPKGDHLLMNDEWKGQFLGEKETREKIEVYQSKRTLEG